MKRRGNAGQEEGGTRQDWGTQVDTTTSRLPWLEREVRAEEEEEDDVGSERRRKFWIHQAKKLGARSLPSFDSHTINPIFDPPLLQVPQKMYEIVLPSSLASA